MSKRIDVKCMGLEKIAIVDQNRRLSRKRYEVGRWLQWIITRKSQIPDRSLSVPETLSDLERRKTGLRPKESVLVLGLVSCGLGLDLGLSDLILCCETRSCYSRSHHDLEGHRNFSSTIGH